MRATPLCQCGREEKAGGNDESAPLGAVLSTRYHSQPPRLDNLFPTTGGLDDPPLVLSAVSCSCESKTQQVTPKVEDPALGLGLVDGARVAKAPKLGADGSSGVVDPGLPGDACRACESVEFNLSL